MLIMKYANNPANIRFVPRNKWLGLVAEPTQRKFCEFTCLEYGLRALLYLLCKYYSKYNLVTVPDIINRFAPSSENDTASYISFVQDSVKNHEGYIHLNSENCYDPLPFLFVVARAICYYESHTVVNLDDLRAIYMKYLVGFDKVFFYHTIKSFNLI